MQPSPGQFHIVQGTLPINNFHVNLINCIKHKVTSCERNGNSPLARKQDGHVSQIKQVSVQRDTQQTELRECFTCFTTKQHLDLLSTARGG